MMPISVVRHVTTYRYRNTVAFGEHRLMLRPRESLDQHTHESRVEIRPTPVALTWAEDPVGNLVGTATFGRRARELRFEATMRVDAKIWREADLLLPRHAQTFPFSYGSSDMPDLARFVVRQEPDPEHRLDAWVRAIHEADPQRDTWAFLKRLNGTIRRDFAYRRREEPGIQRPTTTLRTMTGSCRDFAVLMIEAVRVLGLAARFVSGYLLLHSGDSRARAAGGNTHAWLQVYLPGAGWIDFDPTSGSVGNANLVRVASVCDPEAATPLSGTFIGFPSDYLDMSVDVTTWSEGSERVCAAG